MKVYVYENLWETSRIDLSTYKDTTTDKYIGELELDIKPEKKVVRKERTFDTILSLQTFLNTLGLLCPDKLKITYEIEE